MTVYFLFLERGTTDRYPVQPSRVYVWQVPGGEVSPSGVPESCQVSASSHLTLRPLRRKNGGGTLLRAWSLDRPVHSRRQEGLELWRP